MDECVKVPLPNVIINGDTLIYVRNYVVSTRQLTLPADEAALSIAKTIYKVFDVKCDRVYYGYKPNKDDIIHFYICLERPLCISNLGNSLTTLFNDLVIIGSVTVQDSLTTQSTTITPQSGTLPPITTLNSLIVLILRSKYAQ